ncbi:uncharacterized protein LOC122663183 [Telopea speciosissima]|uniref:uncharacterized protein LOC122663183 n=1 Tax=Telopea speciosissima TaxID=54955 RepID=UPI001CC42581|nr:uncharacterized protein LOC122663183 [Telopea speciosissima]
MTEKAFTEFQLANNPPYSSTQTLEPIRISDSISTHSWIPPAPSWVKLNVDAAWSKGSKKGGLGNVIRDHFGHPLLAYSVGVNCDSDFIAEALAIRSGLLFATTGGFRKVLVELDCYSLIQQLSSFDPELAIQSIHHDIVQLQKSFDDCSFSFVPRSANSVADSLAGSTLSVESPIDWPITTHWLLHLCENETTVSNDSLAQ